MLKAVDQHAIDYSGEKALIIGWGSEFNPDNHTYRLFHSSEIADGQYDFVSFQKSKADDLLLKARTTCNMDERIAYYQGCQEELTIDPPYNFLVYLDALYGIIKNGSGISTRTLGHHSFGVLWNIEEWNKK